MFAGLSRECARPAAVLVDIEKTADQTPARQATVTARAISPIPIPADNARYRDPSAGCASPTIFQHRVHVDI